MKNFTSSYYFENEKTDPWFRIIAIRDSLYWNEMFCNSKLFEKKIVIQDYRRPLSNCKPKEEWPHIALPY